MSRIGMNGVELPQLAICVVVWNDQSGITASYNANDTINWNKALVNRYSMWSPSKPNRIKVPVDGYYKIGATVRFNSTHTTFNDWNIMLNSDVIVLGQSSPAVVLRACHGTGGWSTTCAATIVKLKSGDFLTVGLERAYTLFSDASRFFVYEVRGTPATYGKVHYV